MLSAAVVILLATFLYVLICAKFLSRRVPGSSKTPHRISLQWLQFWLDDEGAVPPATVWRPQMRQQVHAPALHRSLGLRAPGHSCGRAPRPGAPSTCRGTGQPEYLEIC